jgi:hypothetical protein
MEPDVSLPPLQESAIGPHSEPDECNPLAVSLRSLPGSELSVARASAPGSHSAGPGLQYRPAWRLISW